MAFRTSWQIWAILQSNARLTLCRQQKRPPHLDGGWALRSFSARLLSVLAASANTPARFSREAFRSDCAHYFSTICTKVKSSRHYHPNPPPQNLSDREVGQSVRQQPRRSLDIGLDRSHLSQVHSSLRRDREYVAVDLRLSTLINHHPLAHRAPRLVPLA